MDFAKIESMDPSCKNEFFPFFKESIPCQMELDYNTSSQVLNTTECLNFRILKQGEEQRPMAVKFELSTEADVQLFYQCTI